LIEKIIVIELDKMLSCAEIKRWTKSFYTSFESLFQMDSIYILYRKEFNLKEKMLKKWCTKTKITF